MAKIIGIVVVLFAAATVVSALWPSLETSLANLADNDSAFAPLQTAAPALIAVAFIVAVIVGVYALVKDAL